MHGAMPINGPGVWIAGALVLLAFVGATFVVVDTLRRPRHHMASASRIVYLVVSSVYALAFVAGVTMRYAGVLRDYAGTLVLVVAATGVLSIAVTISYLLDVTFPPADKLAERASRDAEAGIAPRASRVPEARPVAKSAAPAQDTAPDEDDGWFTEGDR